MGKSLWGSFPEVQSTRPQNIGIAGSGFSFEASYTAVYSHGILKISKVRDQDMIFDGVGMGESHLTW